MATERNQHVGRSLVVYSYWPYAILLGGIVGAIRPMLTILGNVGPTAGVLTTLPEFQLWWMIHIGYSAVFGAGYGLIAYHRRLRSLSESIPTGAVLGLGYGVVLWLGNVIIGWNLILTTYVFTLVDPIDPLAAGPIIDHVVYGIALGVVYAAVVPRLSTYRG